MKTTILAVVVGAAIVGAYFMTRPSEPTLITADPVEEMFTAWLSEHGKSYESVYEYTYRLSVFKDQIKRVEEINSNNGNSHEAGLNHFSDINDEEYKEMLGYKPLATKKSPKYLVSNEDPTEPKSVNWFEEGCVQAVKDQGQCGSCYSFSATGAMESAHCIATGELVSLAEKDCMDCSFRQGNQGCNGGSMEACFTYFQKDGKICLESEYPYKAKYEVCKEKKCTNFVEHPVDDYQTVPHKSFEQMMLSLDHGPVSIAIEADQDIFRTYKAGIIVDPKNEDDDDKACGTDLDHGVLAVGYSYNGDAKSAENYILVKNSWSAKWGEAGFVRISMLKQKDGGTCGLLLDGSYPETH